MRIACTSTWPRFSRPQIAATGGAARWLIRAWRIGLPGLCLVAVVGPGQAAADVIRLPPYTHTERSLVFDLTGVRGEVIDAAWLEPGRRRMDPARITAAAHRGRLRVRRGQFRPRPSARLIARPLSRYRLALSRSARQPGSSPETPPGHWPQPPGEPFRFFSPSSFWNAPLAPDAPLDPSSSALSAQLRDEAQQEIADGIGPWITTHGTTTPLYTVPADQPTVRVALDTLGTGGWARDLQTAFEAVPIPPGARPGAGSQGQMTIWQPSTDKLWEFWLARKDAQGDWRAGFGGAMANVSQSPGYYTSSSWPGANYEQRWGATASGLPVIGGTILLDELRRGRIDHALAMNIPFARAGVFSWPAQRTDGRLSDAGAIPYGARFRLDPDLDIAALNLPPMVRMIAEAAQRYGMVVRNQTGIVIGFLTEDTSLLGADDPFWSGGRPRLDGYFQGLSPRLLMARFPWDHLQLMKMTLCNRLSPTCPWPR